MNVTDKTVREKKTEQNLNKANSDYILCVAESLFPFQIVHATDIFSELSTKILRSTHYL